MKKALIALLSLILCLSLFSCTTDNEGAGEQGNKEDSSFKGDFETPFVDLEFN